MKRINYPRTVHRPHTELLVGWTRQEHLDIEDAIEDARQNVFPQLDKQNNHEKAISTPREQAVRISLRYTRHRVLPHARNQRQPG